MKPYENLRDAAWTYAPKTLLWGQLLLRRRKLWDRAGVIFIHIPKNGGTSISNALYGTFMGHFPLTEVERWTPASLKSLPSFAIARNPWDRTLSAYRFAVAAKKGSLVNHRLLRVERYSGPEFASFERFVLEWLPGRDLSREDWVFQPQCRFVLDRQGALGLSHLGRLERLQATKEYLEDLLRRKITVEHMNRTGSLGDYRRHYTPECRDMVASVYATDLDLLQYEF